MPEITKLLKSSGDPAGKRDVRKPSRRSFSPTILCGEKKAPAVGGYGNMKIMG
jgi:hypothetical protein